MLSFAYESDVGYVYISLSQIAIFLILLVYAIIAIVKVAKKQKVTELKNPLFLILILAVVNTATISALTASISTLGAFIFFKDEHSAPLLSYSLFALVGIAYYLIRSDVKTRKNVNE